MKKDSGRFSFNAPFAYFRAFQIAFAIALGTAAPSVYASVTFTTVFDFPGAAAKPTFSVVRGSDGNFYGTTAENGATGKGSIYRVTPKGEITTIYSFTGGVDGVSPSSSLAKGPDGNFYGTTSFNHDNTTYGTIYKVTPAGVLTTLHTFTGPDGQFPSTELVLGNDGKFYGTLHTGTSGGASDGAVYSITTAGAYKIIYSFKFTDPGSAPRAALIKGKDGNFYGTTSSGQNGFPGGTVFKLTPAGVLTTLHSFVAATDGSAPGKLVQGKDGNFYGTTTNGGNGGSSGAKAFKVTPNGTFTVLHSFDTAANGYPNGVPLVQASDGNFYGTCSNGGKDGYGVVYRLTPAGSFAIIHAFPAVPVGVLTAALEGANPDAPLIDGGDGFLYGTTSNGAGDREIVFRGDGTVFKIALNGTFHLVAPFFSAPDGKEPHSALLGTPDGGLAGVAAKGGEKSFGTFFTLSPTGEFKLIHSFDPDLKEFHPITITRGPDGAFYGFNVGCLSCGSASTEYHFFKVTTSGKATVMNVSGANIVNGNSFVAPLVLGPDGAFYGPLLLAMAGSENEIVRVTPTGEVTVLHQFHDNTSAGPLVFTPAGKLIGVRLAGGGTPGSIYQIDPATGAFNNIYTFKQGEGGDSINFPLVVATDGNFYGTTNGGGTDQQGSVFKVTPAGEFTLLHSFTNGPDGIQPEAGLIQATDGKFYGTTTLGGGPDSGGAIFSITPSRALTTLHQFPVPGGHPDRALTQAKDGSFYGALSDAGVVENGTLFRLVVDGVPPQSSPAQLLNISTRMEVLTGNNVLIGGFIVTGSDQKKVLVRGLGPSLPVSGPLADPTLELHNRTTTLAKNDDWKQNQRTAIEATTIPPSKDAESAIVATLPGGNSAYTAILAGKGGMTGVGLVEVYDLAQTANSTLANISTRGFVDTGDNVMIGGLILGPDKSGPARVLVRGIGPSLSAAGISGALQDPTLELHNSNGAIVAQNDNWQDTQKAEIIATTIPPTKDAESAIVRTLSAGNYTAILRGKSGTTGVALVELYNLQ
jgi:uncharacterized repeat protein (TIGR03803 family)